jgi:hypothetical protein
MMINKCLACLFCFFAGSAAAETVFITASRDATLIENPAGSLANGAGPVLFAGRTNQSKNALRRGLVYFDVANALPPRAIIKRAFLTLHLTASNSKPGNVTIHRVKNDWGEGASFSAGGGGAPAEAGDTTWLHAFYTDQYWSVEGGYFANSPSATALVEGSDHYTWQSTHRLVADVTQWLHAPDRNFGWILIGDESTPQSAKRFDSRESAVAENRPVLTIEYRLPGRHGERGKAGSRRCKQRASR